MTTGALAPLRCARPCPQPQGRGGRALRAAVFTLAGSVLAVVGHHVASGAGVFWRGAAVVFALSWPVARVSRPWWQVAAATGVAQLVVHRALSGGRAAHGHGAPGGGHGAVSEAVVRTAHHSTGVMVLAHAVAAAALALLMHRADRALSLLPETVGRWAQAAAAGAARAFGLRRRSRPAPRPRAVRMPRAAGVAAVRATVLLGYAVARRGPPGGRAKDVFPDPGGPGTCAVRPAPLPKGSPTVNAHHSRSRRRLGLAAAASLVLLGLAAGPAAAHAEVTASDPRALAENVTLSFTSEAESDTSGIAQLRVVLPEGIAPDAVTLKAAPKAWQLKSTADGFTIGGTALATGTDAEFSIVVRQLPEAKSLVFKTIETYGDGKVSRWIEVPTNGEKVENPAPVLELKPAAPGAKPIAPSPSPTPTPEAPTAAATTQPPTAAPAPSASPDSAGEGDSNTGVVIGVVAVVALLGVGGAVWWRRSRG
ncbi:YcnI family protein [Streptomyces bambusae]|uniref:DUF1775 domain-containing protein n=1 Tax=Streptomyces bambusae TaxID=1550616 RepID=UPI001CFDFC4C|nr:DUF1775 domain-containing protein [Streptomyces bambusae]MCB5163891.1 YcnI family protein [Streptomyces bambusae]